MFAIIFGIGLAAFTLGGLAQQPNPPDVLPEPLEAGLLGLVFIVASMPGPWIWFRRAFLPLPAFLLFYEILTGRRPPLPTLVAFLSAGCYALFVTAYSAYIAERKRS